MYPCKLKICSITSEESWTYMWKFTLVVTCSTLKHLKLSRKWQDSLSLFLRSNHSGPCLGVTPTSFPLQKSLIRMSPIFIMRQHDKMLNLFEFMFLHSDTHVMSFALEPTLIHNTDSIPPMGRKTRLLIISHVSFSLARGKHLGAFWW